MSTGVKEVCILVHVPGVGRSVYEDTPSDIRKEGVSVNIIAHDKRVLHNLDTLTFDESRYGNLPPLSIKI